MRPPSSKDSIVSKVMRSNRSSGTSLELKIRKEISAAGIRGYRLNLSGAPGRPDIAFTKHKLVIMINGCFWHGCRRCIKSKPKTNRRYWVWKIEGNRKRDKNKLAQLKRAGWRVCKVWEHDIKRGNLSPVLSWLKRELKRA